MNITKIIKFSIPFLFSLFISKNTFSDDSNYEHAVKLYRTYNYTHDINLLNEATRLLEYEAETGNSKAQLELGFIYEEEFKNQDKAHELYLQSAKKGNTEAMFMMGEISYNKGNLNKMKYWFKLAADNGDIFSSFLIGQILFFSKDYLNALKYLEYASNNGNNRASELLGDLYYKKRNYDIKQDFNKALSFYEKSYKQGNANSAYKGYKLILNGWVKNTNINDAISMLYFSAKSKHPKSSYYYGVYLLNNKNIKNGLEYIEYSASKNYNKALYALGDFYYFGRNVEKNIKLSYQYYKKAADNNYLPAIEKITSIHSKHLSEKEDPEFLYKYHLIAANLGDAYSQFNLASLYYDNQIESDKREYNIIKWSKKSYLQGVRDAEKLLEYINEKRDPN